MITIKEPESAELKTRNPIAAEIKTGHIAAFDPPELPKLPMSEPVNPLSAFEDR